MSVPILRFREFLDSWNKFSLKDIAVKIQDGTHFSPVVSELGDFKYLTSKNIKNGYIDLSNLTYISEKAHKEIYKRCDVRQGDVLLTKDGTIGQVCVNTLSEPFSLLSSVAFIRTKHTFSNYFLYHLLLSPNGQEEINKSIAGQALKRITLTKINSYIYSFPSFEEQIKIANFLTAVDDKITHLTKKHVLLSKYKKGLMQHFFSQKLRFKDDDGGVFPEWEEKNLSEIVQIVGGGTPDTSVAEYWQGDVQWFTPTEIKTKYATNSLRTITKSGLKNSSAKILPVGTLLFSSRATVGDVSIALNECTTNQGFQSMIVNDKNNNEFIYYWILNNKNAFLEKASGSTFLEISKKEIEKLPVKCPCIKEQTKIANFLNAIDEKITVIQTQLQAVKQYKQGLLQQMFV